MNLSLLQSVICKIIAGINDWTLEELQFHKNNPELVERELVNSQQDGPYDVYVSSAQISFAERNSIYQSSPQIKRIISKPTAVILALQHEFMREAKVAVITIENNNFNLGVYDVGDGVIEELHLLSGDTNIDYIQQLQNVFRTMGKITCLVISSNETMDQRSIQKIESSLNICAIYRSNLNELIVRGAFIYSGVLGGFVRDVLLIQMLPNLLYCETLEGDRFDLLKAQDKITLIPTRQTCDEIATKARKLFIKENGRNEPIAVIQLNSYSAENIVHHISIETDIDTNFALKFIITDLNSKETSEIRINK